MIQEILNKPLSETIPYIFQRESVYVPPETTLEKICSFLFATGPYQDGIVIVEHGSPIGRIGGYHVLKHIRENIGDLKQKPVGELMEKLPLELSEKRDLYEVIELFKKNRFCFAPIKTTDGRIVAVSIRDMLPLVKNMKINIPIRAIYSKMIFVSEGIRIKDALDIMFDKRIRRLGIESGTEPTRIINDRNILEYLCFISVLEEDILSKKIDHIRSQKITDIHPSTSISNAAEVLMSNPPACSSENHNIVTPYDLVNKTLLSQVYA